MPRRQPAALAHQSSTETSGPSCERLLAAMLRRYWSLPDNTPMATFRKGVQEIARVELLLGEATASRILHATATEFFNTYRICPFCGMTGQLHLQSDA